MEEATRSMDAMPIYYPHIIRRSPIRTCDWRWQRAQVLVAEGRNYSRRRDDADTGHAVHYLRTLARCQRTTPEPPPPQRFADIHSARQIHEGDPSVRLTMQARLLAGQAPEEIAERSGMSASVIDTYERVFFTCRAHLNERDWVFLYCIGPQGLQDINPDRRIILKCFAFYGGCCVLEAVLPYFAGDRKLLDAPADLTTAEGRCEESIRLAVAFLSLPWDEQSFRLSLRLTLLAIEMESRVTTRPVASLLSPSMEKLLTELSEATWATTDQTASPTKSTTTSQLDQQVA